MKQKLTTLLLLSYAVIFGQNSITTTSTIAGATTTYTFNLTAGSGGQTWNAISAKVVPGSTLPSFSPNVSPASTSDIDVFLNGSTTETPGYLRNFGNGELKIDISQALSQGTTIKVIIKNVINPSAASNSAAKIAFQNSNYVDLNSFSNNFNITAGTLATSENTFSKNKTEIYPNPTTDFIRLTNLQSKVHYKINDLNGQLILAGEYNNKDIDVRELPAGIYILTYDHQSIKFVKK
ncbi:T9SS type A sorting domain-containing protein [Chryseobacterium sp. Tr-659]|uniref:T9SS type A sorting domain-containing protein n=1 Tax=Chryseobacterium sp. Tr-659 TaxID=2608340 RepID=UPI0014201986|nr:T9SS type A sorting domain-containing protein [Chryseobacterium sp. Tr-659]NIF06684.1 T9SS type A sorting domain-containing protein [Chryseobacterium sp. Tr-659]